MHPYHKLIVWQRAHALAKAVYETTTTWREQNLTAQLRRAATSVTANIVECAGSATQAQFARYLGFALASAHETQSHLEFAHQVGFLEESDHQRYDVEIVSIKKMLTALLRTVRENDAGRKLVVKQARATKRRSGI